MEAFGEDCVLSFHLENITRTAKRTTQSTIGVKDGGKEDDCESIWKAFLFKHEYFL